MVRIGPSSMMQPGRYASVAPPNASVQWPSVVSVCSTSVPTAVIDNLSFVSYILLLISAFIKIFALNICISTAFTLFIQSFILINN